MQSTIIRPLISLITLLFTANLLFASETNSIVEIRQQLEKLKSENVALKQENQVLRKLVFERQNAPQPPPVSSPTPSTVSTPLPPAPPSTPISPTNPPVCTLYLLTTPSRTSRIVRPGGLTCLWCHHPKSQ